MKQAGGKHTKAKQTLAVIDGLELTRTVFRNRFKTDETNLTHKGEKNEYEFCLSAGTRIWHLAEVGNFDNFLMKKAFINPPQRLVEYFV